MEETEVAGGRGPPLDALSHPSVIIYAVAVVSNESIDTRCQEESGATDSLASRRRPELMFPCGRVNAEVIGAPGSCNRQHRPFRAGTPSWGHSVQRQVSHRLSSTCSIYSSFTKISIDTRLIRCTPSGYKQLCLSIVDIRAELLTGATSRSFIPRSTFSPFASRYLLGRNVPSKRIHALDDAQDRQELHQQLVPGWMSALTQITMGSKVTHARRVVGEGSGAYSMSWIATNRTAVAVSIPEIRSTTEESRRVGPPFWTKDGPLVATHSTGRLFSPSNNSHAMSSAASAVCTPVGPPMPFNGNGG